MNNKQRTLIYTWVFGIAMVISFLIFGWVGLPVLLLFGLFTPYARQLAELLRDDQDKTWKEYMNNHKRILIALIIYTVLAYTSLIYKLISRSGILPSMRLQALLYVSFIPWLIFTIGHQIYLYKQYGKKT